MSSRVGSHCSQGHSLRVGSVASRLPWGGLVGDLESSCSPGKHRCINGCLRDAAKSDGLGRRGLWGDFARPQQKREGPKARSLARTCSINMDACCFQALDAPAAGGGAAFERRVSRARPCTQCGGAEPARPPRRLGDLESLQTTFELPAVADVCLFLPPQFFYRNLTQRNALGAAGRL